MNNQAALHLNAHVNRKLRLLVAHYFEDAGNDIQANKDLYADLESQWKEFIYKVTRTNKRVKPGLDEFAKLHKQTLMILQILERDPQQKAEKLYAMDPVTLSKLYSAALEGK